MSRLLARIKRMIMPQCIPQATQLLLLRQMKELSIERELETAIILFQEKEVLKSFQSYLSYKTA